MFKCIVIFFGFTILNCQFASADNIDISTKFNRDTIAVEAIEPTGNGYRNSGEVFITDGFSGETPPAGGVNLPDPSDGFGELSSAGRNYRFGQYDSSNTTQFNTWIISFDSVDTINITNQSFSSFGVLYSAVGYNPQDNNNGTVTVTYTDLTEQTFVWDVADSNGDGFDNLATIALGGNSPNGMDLFNTDSNSFPGPNNRRWYSQEFAGLDGNKVVDSLTFSVVGVGDFSGDAEFGIYAVSATTTAVPVCASGGTLIEGTGEINDFNSTCGSDDSYWAAHGATFAFQVADPVVQFELTATAPAGFGGSTISVEVEASKQNANGNLNLRAQLFNFTIGNYVSLPGILPLATADQLQSFGLPFESDPNDFIEPETNEVWLLIQTIQTSGLPNVRTQLDEVQFVFE